MNKNRISVVLTSIAMLSVPTFASADKPTDKKPGGNAYGKYCQAESKKHVKGEKGTAFSRCVAAMKQVAEEDATPKQACKGLSKKHVKGEKGTAYSRCIVAAAKAGKDKEKEEAEPTPTPTA